MSRARWMAEIFYNNGSETAIVAFDELCELHDIIAMGPNWNTIERIVVTLNRPSVRPTHESKP
jgi:hypothetical protein